MLKKLRSKKGMSMTEMLVALAVVAMIAVVLATGIRAAANIYRRSSDVSAAEALSGTLISSLEDEFRFAENCREDGGKVVYDSKTFGKGVSVSQKDGIVTINGLELISGNVYTNGLKAGVDVSLSGSIVTVNVRIFSGQGTEVLAEHSVRVRALNM